MGMAVGVKWAQATSERRSISDSVSHGHGVKHGEPSRLFQEGVTAIPCDSQRNTAWSRIDALFGVLPIHLFAAPTVASLAAACCWCPEHSTCLLPCAAVALLQLAFRILVQLHNGLSKGEPFRQCSL